MSIFDTKQKQTWAHYRCGSTRAVSPNTVQPSNKQSILKLLQFRANNIQNHQQIMQKNFQIYINKLQEQLKIKSRQNKLLKKQITQQLSNVYQIVKDLEKITGFIESKTKKNNNVNSREKKQAQYPTQHYGFKRLKKQKSFKKLFFIQ